MQYEECALLHILYKRRFSEIYLGSPEEGGQCYGNPHTHVHTAACYRTQGTQRIVRIEDANYHGALGENHSRECGIHAPASVTANTADVYVERWDTDGNYLGVVAFMSTYFESCHACTERVLRNMFDGEFIEQVCGRDGLVDYDLVCSKVTGEGGTVDSYGLSCGKTAGTNGTADYYKVKCGYSENQIIKATIVYPNS